MISSRTHRRPKLPQNATAAVNANLALLANLTAAIHSQVEAVLDNTDDIHTVAGALHGLDASLADATALHRAILAHARAL